MTVTRILVERIQIGGANASAGHGCVGYPAITAFMGYAQVLARSFAGVEAGQPLIRFAIVHHEGRPRLYGRHGDRMTQKRYVHFTKTPPEKSRQQIWFTPSTDIRPQVDLTVSLLLEIEISDDRLALLMQRPHEAAAHVGVRALGGVISAVRKVRVGGDPLDLLTSIGRGYAVVDLTPSLFLDDRDPLDAMLDRLSAYRRPGDPDRPFAAHTGYLAVSEAKMRTEARGAIMHQHAEPIFGLAAFRRTYAVDRSAPAFWRPSVDRDAGVFIVKGEHV